VPTDHPHETQVPIDGGGHVTALTYAAKPRRATLVLAHGAGSNQLHPFMVRVARGLAERGVETTTFNFAYTENKRRAPDPAPKLEACFRSVLVSVRGRSGEERPFIGGKSMGGRMASHLAAEGEKTRGLVFLGYPLHPPGKPDQLRSRHLPLITAPMLFVQGTRDAFGTTEELAPILATLKARVEVFPIEQGDHSFKVPKRTGKTEEEILSAVMDRVAVFVAEPLYRMGE
jgi:uncharacterized protein